MDNELLALVAILPGIEAAIEKLEAERDLIVGRLGLSTKRRAKPLSVVLEPAAKKKPNLRLKRVKCPDCGKFFGGTQGLSAHRRAFHKKDAA
jgi:hypothetical protein